jgi:PepB aminopeptidase
MNKIANISITSQPISHGWQAQNLVQVVNDTIYIYLPQVVQDNQRAVQQAGRSIEKLGVDQARLEGELWDEKTQWSFALGFTCVGKLTAVDFTGNAQMAARLSKKLAVYAWCRELTNQTPEQLYPEALAKLTTDYLTAFAPQHISTRLISGEQLQENGWVGIYHVGKGSCHPPCLLELDYNPSQDDSAPVTACLVGKGITFDSGGYSIKSNAGMFDMKADMGGAAVVAGALALAIELGLTQRVKLILCCAENMISSRAYKLGDILTYKNGVSCEIANTDAEGRIVLADGLLLAKQYKPTLTIDAATLTGASVMATGGDYSALFTLDKKLSKQAIAVSEKVNEPLWPLPLTPWHKEKCPSVFADTANSTTQKGGGAGGASNAAGFLSRFSTDQGWLHFDLSAAYNSSADGLWAAGATGLGIATIAQLLLEQ